MRIVLVNKSDARGGAAVVTFRLMQALRSLGVDAVMLVEEKLTDSPYVELAAPRNELRGAFLAERLGIFLCNGFSRKTLFRIDTLAAGVDIASHPWAKDADAFLLNWVNQGMLSASGIRKLARLGKPMIWTMHDMWCFTGICHHAHACREYEETCRSCPLLTKSLACKTLANKVWHRKKELYDDVKFGFVPVSRWLGGCAGRSSLLRDASMEVIPNPFHFTSPPGARPAGAKTILFGAARLDDPIKDLPTLKRALEIFRHRYPALAADARLVTFGGVKEEDALQGFAIPAIHKGMVASGEIEALYREATVVVSSSSFETLPGTLVEGQAYGAVPVAFRRGGQEDIVDDGVTGFLADWDSDLQKRSERLAEAIASALAGASEEMQRRMYDSAVEKFSAENVARRYLSFISFIESRR